MRIISEQHDYYDVVQAQGQDQTLLYLRKEEEVEIKGVFPFPHMTIFRTLGKKAPHLSEYIVGFCGEIYPVLHLSASNHTKPVICFSLEEVDAFIGANFRDREVKEYHSKPKYSWRTKFWATHFLRTSFEKFFAECAERQNAFRQMFEDKRCPIFVAHHAGSWRDSSGTLTWNACLREHEFFRVFDPFRAFQEIAMFLGSLAVPLKPIPKVSDRDMVMAKGFDKWSFRQPPKGK